MTKTMADTKTKRTEQDLGAAIVQQIKNVLAATDRDERAAAAKIAELEAEGYRPRRPRSRACRMAWGPQSKTWPGSLMMSFGLGLHHDRHMLTTCLHRWRLPPACPARPRPAGRGRLPLRRRPALERQPLFCEAGCGERTGGRDKGAAGQFREKKSRDRIAAFLHHGSGPCNISA